MPISLRIQSSAIRRNCEQVARKWEHQVHQLLVEYDRVLDMGPDFFKRFPKKFE